MWITDFKWCQYKLINCNKCITCLVGVIDHYRGSAYMGTENTGGNLCAFSVLMWISNFSKQNKSHAIKGHICLSILYLKNLNLGPDNSLVIVETCSHLEQIIFIVKIKHTDNSRPILWHQLPISHLCKLHKNISLFKSSQSLLSFFFSFP